MTLDDAAQAAEHVEDNLVSVADLSVAFGRRGTLRSVHRNVRAAVQNVSFTIGRGEILGLVGESGSGKTTTGRAILQLCRPSGGSVRLESQELTTLSKRKLRGLRRRMQMIFQDPYSSLNPRMRVGQIIGEPLFVHGIVRRKAIPARVAELLQEVGLDASAADNYPGEFSGGQRQRISIARAIAVEPDFIVADEPTSALDVSVQAQVLSLLKRLQSELGLAYLFISHDLAVVRMMADRIAVMREGQIVEITQAEDVLKNAVHPYSRALVDAVPIPDPHLERQRLSKKVFSNRPTGLTSTG